MVEVEARDGARAGRSAALEAKLAAENDALLGVHVDRLLADEHSFELGAAANAHALPRRRAPQGVADGKQLLARRSMRRHSQARIGPHALSALIVAAAQDEAPQLACCGRAV
eukprot:2232578-Pleurochrysis_carterae.AAC.1